LGWLAGHYKSILLPADEEKKIMHGCIINKQGVLSNLPGVHTLAAMGLLWALEKGYYAAHV
jgi:hypothetical protein